MQVISNVGNYVISSSFGASIVEGTIPGASQGQGTPIQFSISQLIPIYRSFYWKIEPISGQFADFWDPSSNIIGGSPATQFDLSGFGTTPGNFPFNLYINADDISESDESFSIAFYLNVTDSAPIARASFTILNDDRSNSFSIFRNGFSFQENPTIYAGPVTYLKYQYFGSMNNEVVIGSPSNDFINLLGGDDAANGGGGNDVIDGGTGSNFLNGGADLDVFFLDGRGASITWSTIADWEIGEQLSVFGWHPGLSKIIWLDNSGTPGYTGATMHADLNGDGAIETSVTWSARTRDILPTPLEYDGLLWFT